MLILALLGKKRGHYLTQNLKILPDHLVLLILKVISQGLFPQLRPKLLNRTLLQKVDQVGSILFKAVRVLGHLVLRENIIELVDIAVGAFHLLLAWLVDLVLRQPFLPHAPEALHVVVKVGRLQGKAIETLTVLAIVQPEEQIGGVLSVKVHLEGEELLLREVRGADFLAEALLKIIYHHLDALLRHLDLNFIIELLQCFKPKQLHQLTF